MLTRKLLSTCLLAGVFVAGSSSTYASQECFQAIPELDSSEFFGYCLDLDGTRLAVGSLQWTGSPTPNGWITVYEQNPVTTAYEVVQRVQPSDLINTDRFVHRISLDGDRMAATSLHADTNGTPDTGAVYVFERDPGTGLWQEVQKLFLPDGEEDDEFGYDLELYGDRLLIGAPSHDTTGTAYLYERDAITGIWNLETEFLPTGLTTFASFGFAVALDGDQAVIAGPRDGASLLGALLVHERSGPGSWALVQTVRPTTTQVGLTLGRSLCIEGDRLIAGAPSYNDPNVPGSLDGAGFVFERSPGSGQWAETKILEVSTSQGGLLGTFCALDGDAILLSAHNEPTGVGSDRGIVYRFEYSQTLQDWTLADTIAAPINPATFFGFGIALDGDRTAIGAYASFRYAFIQHSMSPDCNNNGIGDLCEITAGTTQDFNGDYQPDSCEEVGFAYCNPATPNTTGLPAMTTAYGSGALGANDVFLSTTDLPTGQFAFYLASQGTTIVNMPGGSQGDLCVAGAPIGRFNQVENILNAGATGTVGLTINLTNIPQPTGPTAVMVGETWYFQLWYRDFITGSGSTANFSDSRGILFQ